MKRKSYKMEGSVTMDYVNAFWVGGLICALVQILLEKTKLLPGRVMVLLVCSGAVLGAVGIYEPFSEFAGAGANVPLLGFGNTLWKGMKTAVDESGFLGLFTGGFTACAVIIAQNRFSINSKRRICQHTLTRITYQVSHAFDLKAMVIATRTKTMRGNEENVEYFYQTGIKNTK